MSCKPQVLLINFYVTFRGKITVKNIKGTIGSYKDDEILPKEFHDSLKVFCLRCCQKWYNVTSVIHMVDVTYEICGDQWEKNKYKVQSTLGNIQSFTSKFWNFTHFLNFFPKIPLFSDQTLV